MEHNKDKKQNTPKSLPANGADDGNQIERVPAQLQEFIDVIPADKKQDFLNALVGVEVIKLCWTIATSRIVCRL